jgi:hypothetical protein
MNWWISAAQYATETLALVLIVRLLSLRDKREGVYVVFALFLAFQLLSSTEYLILSRWFANEFDYRVVWIASTFAGWLFSLSLVYSLAKAVLAGLPGVFRFSRILLNSVFPLAIIGALLTVRGEYFITGAWRYADPMDRLVTVGSVVDRAISMASLLVLVAILAFILWFPVRMPRNLAIISVGLVVYFGSKTGLALLRSYAVAGTISKSAQDLREWLSIGVSVVVVCCFLYWIIFIDPKGQTSQVRLGHSWHSGEQGKLIQQLEALNLALLRNSQRLEL